VDLEDLSSTSNVWSIDGNMSIESTRSHQGTVENICSIRTGQYDNVLVGTETVHLDEKLVERRLSLIVTAKASTLASGFTDRIDFIDENDTGRILFGVGKEISDSRRTDTDKHLDEFGSGDG
jgi:hypothetical protein